MAILLPPVNSRDHVSGVPNATIELVEYADFQCPYCREAFFVVKQLQERFANRLRFVFRNFPLAEAHEYAMDAAMAAEAAGRQDRFWEMHDAIFTRQSELNDALLLGLAADFLTDLSQFAEDMQAPDLVSKVDADFESGVRSGVNGTPTFYLNGKRYNGDYRVLSSFMED
ncbi:thioredoxin-like protein [Chitinophaga niastensis]|uniref:Thioredoxin-like protein n=1 Tax=Chitinophaga niastensis TaxID=536980 RepID=A0A2P8HMX4_CHINA|nr:thioredoxin domain-containing protein [Chitinophaga niastensis]PSL47578.1 thioredoxin-like protein [Chitinophaga niastensis]